MHKILTLIFVFFLYLSGATIVSKASADANSFSIEDAVFRPGISDRPGVVFFKLSNISDKNKTLISAQSTSAKKIEIHTHDMKNGVMRMRRLDALTIDANTSVHLKPHGLHLMVFGYTASEDEMSITLHFDTEEQITFTPEIVSYGAK